MAISEAQRDRFRTSISSSPSSISVDKTEQAAQTPGERSGSFLSDKDCSDETVRVMPTDPITNLPYPVLPKGLQSASQRDCANNYHHHFYYKNDKDLLGGRTDRYSDPESIPLNCISGLAVRICRGQTLPVGDHEELHRRFKAGPEPPRNQAAKYRTVVLASLGGLPRFALDFSRPPGNEVVPMNSEHAEYFLSRGVLFAEKQNFDRSAYHRRAVIGSFMLRYAAAQNLEHVSAKVIREFLSADDMARRVELGGLIMREAIHQSIEPIMQDYNAMREEGMVPLAAPNLATNVKKFVRARPAVCILSELHSRLAATRLAAA